MDYTRKGVAFISYTFEPLARRLAYILEQDNSHMVAVDIVSKRRHHGELDDEVMEELEQRIEATTDGLIPSELVIICFESSINSDDDIYNAYWLKTEHEED